MDFSTNPVWSCGWYTDLSPRRSQFESEWTQNFIAIFSFLFSCFLAIFDPLSGIIGVKMLYIHGAQIKNAKCLKHYQNFNTNAILTCNTAMEREFYGLSRDVFKNYEIFPIKHKFEYFLQLPELANAHLGFNFKFWGCLRSVWPPKSHISWFSFKYHIEMIFFHIKPFRGYFAIDLILLKKQEIPNNGL